MMKAALNNMTQLMTLINKNKQIVEEVASLQILLKDFLKIDRVDTKLNNNNCLIEISSPTIR